MLPAPALGLVRIASSLTYPPSVTDVFEPGKRNEPIGVYALPTFYERTNLAKDIDVGIDNIQTSRIIAFATLWVRARERAIRAESILAGLQLIQDFLTRCGDYWADH